MLTPSFFPNFGGAEVQALKLSKQLILKGFNVFFLTIREKGLEKESSIDGVKVIRLKSKLFYPLIFFINSLTFLVKNRNSYDILHIHTAYSPMIVGALVSFFFGKPVIVKIPSRKQINYLVKSKIRLFMVKHFISRYIAINKEIENKLIKIGINEEKIIHLPNGVEINNNYVKKEINKNKFSVLFIGRLEKIKNISYLLKNWKKFSDVNSHSELLIIGDGNEQDNLKNISQDLGLVNKVKFMGKLNSEEILLSLNKSDVFVLPSLSEGISNSLLEAMSFGLVPVSNVEGNINVVQDHKSGLLFDLNLDFSLFEKLMLIESDLKLRKNYLKVRMLE